MARKNDSILSNHHGNSASKDSLITWLITFVVVGSMIIVLNLATILTFSVNRHLRRRNVYCLINLAVADMMYGGFGTAYSFCIFVDQYLNSNINIAVKIVIYVLSIFAFVAALMSLALISLERVFATVFPFRYRSTPSRKYVMVFGFLWFLSLVVSLFFNLTPRSQFHAVFICYWVILTVSLTTMFASYTIIFVKVKLQGKRQVHGQRTVSSMVRTQKYERDLAMTLFIFTVVSLLTWLPYLTVRVMFLVNHTSFDLSSSLPSNVSIVFLIQWLNSLINPVIYVYRMRDFRKAFFQLVLRCSRDRANVNAIGSHGDMMRDCNIATHRTNGTLDNKGS